MMMTTKDQEEDRPSPSPAEEEKENNKVEPPSGEGDGCPERDWWHGLSKARQVSGTYDDSAFQLQLLLQRTQYPSSAASHGAKRKRAEDCADAVCDGDGDDAEPTDGDGDDGAGTHSSTMMMATKKEDEASADGEGEAVQLQRKKEKKVVVANDPVTVPLFDVLGYHCVPHCGVYAHDDYEPALPYVFLALPYELVLGAAKETPGLLPARLVEELTGPAADSFPLDGSSFYMMVHPCPSLKECQHFMCNSRREINVITHAWTFPHIQFTSSLEIETVVDMGLFGAQGVEETHMNLADSRFNGLPFNRMEQRMVIISFSPLNAQIRISDYWHWHCFFLVSRHWATSRQCVSFHVIVEDNVLDERLHKMVGELRTLGELVHMMVHVDGDEGGNTNKPKYSPFLVFAQIIERCMQSAAPPNDSNEDSTMSP